MRKDLFARLLKTESFAYPPRDLFRVNWSLKFNHC